MARLLNSWWVLLVLVSLGTSSNAFAEDKPDDSKAKSEKKDATEEEADDSDDKGVTEENIEVPDVRPAELLEMIEDVRKVARSKGYKGVDALDFAIYFPIKAADKILANEDATDEELDAALSAKFKALLAGRKQEIDGFEERLAKFGEDVVTKSPKSRVARLFAFAQLRRDLLDQRELPDNAVAILKEFIELHADDPITGEVTYSIGLRLESADRQPEAMDLYRFLLGKAPTNDYASLIEGKVARIEAIGKPIDVTGPLLGGGTFQVSDLKGKIVVVDYWATWCGPCVAAMPELKDFYAKYKDKGVEIIGISLDDKQEQLENFVKREEVKWPQIFFPEQEDPTWANPIARKYGVNAIPCMMLVDANGNIVEGDLASSKLAEAVDKLLGAASKPEEATNSPKPGE
jgi:thiol-disulfide isomerase/thioredoxin